MEYRIIKVYEKDYDIDYEELFLVKCDEKQLIKLQDFLKKIDNLDYEELETEYGSGKIECVENYILNNFEIINNEIIEINCY